MPCFLGIEPTKKAASTSLNATAGSSVGITSCTKCNAQSLISMTTPSNTPIIGGMSNKRSDIGSVPCYKSRRSGFRPHHFKIFCEAVDLEQGQLSLSVAPHITINDRFSAKYERINKNDRRAVNDSSSAESDELERHKVNIAVRTSFGNPVRWYSDARPGDGASGDQSSTHLSMITVITKQKSLYVSIPILNVRSLNTCFEITSLVGTICSDGAHLHITLGDPDGNTVSGHLVGDAVVETTAEVVLGELNFSSLHLSVFFFRYCPRQPVGPVELLGAWASYSHAFKLSSLSLCAQVQSSSARKLRPSLRHVSARAQINVSFAAGLFDFLAIFGSQTLNDGTCGKNPAQLKWLHKANP
uniref:PPC domain-containing protein n=1 Tax=Timema tahoe TaxID=61484 RepID=A0A7R9FNP7_9NEOP|nr:unnamed protein product [Timema tahoe]